MTTGERYEPPLLEYVFQPATVTTIFTARQKGKEGAEGIVDAEPSSALTALSEMATAFLEGSTPVAISDSALRSN
jgi:hypothetical protein